MRINLKIVGRALYENVVANINADHSAFPKEVRKEAVEWSASYVRPDLSPEDLLSFPDFPWVVLIDAHDMALIERIGALEKEAVMFIKENAAVPLLVSPVLFVFESPEALGAMRELPDVISDWLFAPLHYRELVRRILIALKRKNLLKARLRFGSLTLIPESRSICFEDRTTRLTPSEFTLIQLFLSQIGAVIPFKDLVQFFKLTGKSTEANNIRVAIFQLRLKLEVLTKSRIMLVSVYRQGYCLRYKQIRMAPHSQSAIGHNYLHS